MITLAIDPGSEQSAYCVLNGYRPASFGKIGNEEMLGRLVDHPVDRCVIEMVASYGMPVGAEVFQTCVWIGRFVEAISLVGIEAELIFRQPVRLHFCHSTKAKDSNVTQALVDRFAPGERNHGKGTKRSPGFFFGFAGDCWQSFALAVYAIDIDQQRETA